MPRAATTKPYKPRAPKVEAKPEVPKMADVQDHEWMNWVEYAQSRIRYLPNSRKTSEQGGWSKNNTEEHENNTSRN